MKHLVTLLLSLCLLTFAVADDHTTQGFEFLWHNQPARAKAEFEAALKIQPPDPGAWRGLGLVAVAEDDHVAALAAWRQLFRVAPNQPTTAALWPQFADLCTTAGKDALLEDAARDVLKAKTGPELRAAATLVLANALRRTGRVADSKKLIADLGFISAWQVVGPFDNVSRSGFDKAFAPQTGGDLTKVLVGKDEQPVRWRTLPLVDWDAKCLLGAYLGDGDASVFYAAGAVQSARETPARLRFDPTGAAKVWLNGNLVFSNPKCLQAQAYTPDPIAVTVTLNAGWNSMLVKIADNEKLHGEFRLRFTDPTGGPLLLRADPGQYRFQQDESTPPAAEFPVQSALGAPAQQGLEATLLLAQLQRGSGDNEAAIDTLRTALEHLPEPQPALLHWELAQAYDDDSQKDETRAARVRALALLPQFLPPLLDEIEADESLTPADKVTRLKELAAKWPRSSAVLWQLCGTYMDAELPQDAVAAARRSTSLMAGPEVTSFLVTVLGVEDQHAEAEKILNDALRRFPDHEALLRQRAELLAQSGRAADAIAVYRRLTSREAPATGDFQALVDLLAEAHDLTGAIATIRQAGSLRPQDANIEARLADLLHQNGDDKGALAHYRGAMQLDPAQVSLREKAQLIAGEKPVLTLVPELPVPPATMVVEAGVSQVLLLDEGRELIYPDGALEARFHQVVKVMDGAGVKHCSTMPLTWGSASAQLTVESAKTISTGGKVRDVTAEQDDTGRVSFPSLAPGDVIDLKWRVTDFQKGGLARQFWSNWVFTVMGTPVKTSRYVLVTPLNLPYTVRTHGAVPAPQEAEIRTSTGTAWKVREYRMTNVPQRKVEPMQPAEVDEATWLDVSSITSWQQVAEWYGNLALPRCEPDATIRAKAMELTRNCATEEARLRALHRYVAHEVQYQSTPFRLSAYIPTEGKQVIREKYGDCKDKAALLTALCGAVGIKAHMVLLNGRDDGLTPYLPGPRFNHAINRVETAQGPVWSDATADQLDFGNLPVGDQGVPALVIGDAETDLTTTPVCTAEEAVMTEAQAIELAATGKLSGVLELTARGETSSALKQALQRVPKNREQEVLNKIVGSLVDNARGTGGAITGTDEPDQPVKVRISYEVDNHGALAGNFLLARVPWVDFFSGDQEGLLNPGQRTEAVETADLRGLTRSTVLLQLPAGYLPQDLPAEVKGESPWGSYQFTFKVDHGTLVATRRILVDALRVPVAQSADFAKFLQAIKQECRRQIVLKK